MQMLEFFRTDHGLIVDQKNNNISGFKGQTTQNYGRTYAEHQNMVRKEPNPVQNKNSLLQDQSPYGLLYIFAQIEPAYYLVLTKCVMHKEIKQYEDNRNKY